MAEIFEGEWDDLVRRADLKGRKVRVLVLDEKAKGEEDPWLRLLRQWSENHKPLSHKADDSRDSIYNGTADDPR